MDYYIFTGPKPADILDELTVATGRSPLWPKWVFGFHQGGYGPNYNTADRLREIARAYREARIPIDGLHIDIDIQNRYRNFSTSPTRFPNPARLFSDLHEMGYKLSTNVTPLVSMMPDESGAHSPYVPLDSGRLNSVFVSNRRDDGGGSDEPFIGNVNYGGERFAFGHYADLGKTEIQQWWGDLYRFWLDLGLDMVWQDMATPCMESSVHESPNRFRSIPLNCQLWDNEESRFSAEPMPSEKLPFAKTRNLFSYNLVKSTDDGLRRLAPGRRHFIIARGGFIGEHRHAGVWTGDNMTGWEWLILNIPQSINMGVSGQPIAGSDIGGFGGFGGQGNCDPEMLVRWTSLGAMLPWFRNHYGHYDNKTFQEPYRYGDPTASVCRKVIELRYRWLQVFYDAMHENHRRGAPIVRPLFWHSDDPGIYEHHDWWYWPPNGRGFHYNFSRLDDQFFLGKDILVAPVVLPEWVTGAPERPVYLPSGTRWFAFKDNRYPLDSPIDGGVQFSFRAPWNNDGDPYPNNIPIYIREGAIIPHRELEQFVGERKRAGRLNPLTLNIYPGESGRYRLFLDDEETDRADTHGEYREVEVSHQRTPNGRTVRIHRVHDGYAPPENFYFTACLEPVEPQGVMLRSADGSLNRTLNRLPDADALAASSEPAFYFNGSLRATFVKVLDSQSDVTLQFSH
jgi:alpha-glucosidase